MVAFHRGRLPTDHKLSGGLMIATSLSLDQAEHYIHGTNIEIACDNAESSTTLTGTASVDPQGPSAARHDWCCLF